MYTKAELSRIRSDFWTRFGQYMSPVPSATGDRVNWVNYKTGIKNIRFTMDFTKRNAEAWVEITITETGKRQTVFNAFTSLWQQAFPGSDWIIFAETVKDNKLMSAMKSAHEDVSLFDQQKWPEAISFLKERITQLDRFWAEYRDLIEMIV